jgi:hypothetical protein
MAAEPSSARCVIDLPVRTEWKNIDLVSTSVRDCFTAVDLDRDECQTIAIVVAELMENAIKYGCWSAGREPGFVRVRIDESPQRTVVRVENPVEPGSDALADLSATIAWIQSHRTAEDAYRERLLEIASGRMGKLGLVRVAFEGNCNLEASLSENGSVVTVTASCHV